MMNQYWHIGVVFIIYDIYFDVIYIYIMFISAHCVIFNVVFTLGCLYLQVQLYVAYRHILSPTYIFIQAVNYKTPELKHFTVSCCTAKINMNK